MLRTRVGGKNGLLLGAAFAALMAGSGAQAGNIVTFGANANKCGGAVICSYDGTTGYLNNGMGQPFNLSTISRWFQIDAGGLNLLPNQSMPEPDKGAGGFLVVNDTGRAITSFSLSLGDDFASKTASVHPCTGAQRGNICNNFAAQGGSGSFTYDTELSGADWDRCTQGTVNGQTCTGKAGGTAADFAPGGLTYTWAAEPGKSIPAGGTFTVSFSGWNNDGFTNGSLCDSVQGNLVQNCGFETGDFTDWMDVANANISTDANSGHYAAELSSSTTGAFGNFDQGFTSVSGTKYLVTFYVKALVFTGSAVFQVNVSGSSNGLGAWSASTGNDYSEWTQESFTFTGDGSTDQLDVFIHIDHAAEDWLIDDITITPQ